MGKMAPKEFLERLNAHTEEEQIQIMTNILKWADETQIARQEAELYKRTADKLSDQIVQLKAEAQVAARMQPESGDASGWAEQKQQYEDQIKMLKSKLDFQTKRADGLAESVQAEHDKYEAEHATCEGLAAQCRKLNEEKERLAEKLQDTAGGAAAKVTASAAYTALADENEALKKQLEELRRKAGALDEIDSLKKVNMTQKMQLEELAKEKEALDAKVRDLTSEVDRFKSDSDDARTLAEEKAKLLEENKKLKQQLAESGNMQEHLYKLNMANIELREENDALRAKAGDLGKELEEMQKKQDGENGKKRIENVLTDYLSTLSEEAEQELADRFRETAFILMDCSAEDVVRVMKSPVIGTETNKRLLRNQARRFNRDDIAQSI
ncbi:MAG: hypothetical protein K5695_03255 [Oscillospiraceae bacterium]|nr:hypothetical protein [Oscillospiraceae bacterium]